MLNFVKLSDGSLVNLEHVILLTSENHLQVSSGNVLTVTEADREEIELSTGNGNRRIESRLPAGFSTSVTANNYDRRDQDTDQAAHDLNTRAFRDLQPDSNELTQDPSLIDEPDTTF